MQALNSLKKVYSDKELVDFDIERKYKDKVDVRVVNMIMEEIESKLDSKTLVLC